MLLTIFNPIQYIPYSIDKSSEGFIIANIFQNYKKPFNSVLKNYQLKNYRIKGSPRPEQLSHEIYGNSQLYWVLLMCNDVYDPFHGWIKPQQACYDVADKKYPNAENLVLYHMNKQGSKFYNLVEYPTGSQNWYDKGDKTRTYLQYKGPLSPVSAYEHEIAENEKKRLIKIIPVNLIDAFIQDFIKEISL